MENITKSVGVLCICGYVTGLLMNLTTTAYTQKAIRLVAVLYILSTFLFPLSKTNYDFDIDFPVNTASSVEQTEDYIISQSEIQMENIISQRLKDKNISYSQVFVHINKQTDGISVEEINITGLNSGDRPIVRRLLDDVTTKDKIKFGE